MMEHPATVVDGAPPPLLRMRDITKRYPGVVANDGIDLEVRAGESVALLGENGAGKSTLMKVLFGLERPDGGTIELDGEEVSFSGPRDALDHGIGMVHQHLMLVPDMTVAENVALGRARGLRADRRVTARSVLDLSERFGLALDPDDRVGDLPVAAQQRVEIVKLLHRGARLLILDEPSASVGPVDWLRLADILRSLVANGASVIFISHKLDEIAGVADRAVVLRAGRVVGSANPTTATKASLARLMVGRDVVLRVERPPVSAGEVVMSMDDITVDEPGGRCRLDGVSLAVRAGEVLGVAGVEGNGQRDLLEVLTGLRLPTSGRVLIDGQAMDTSGPAQFVAAGGAYVPEDRHREAVALDLSIRDNLMLRDVARSPYARGGVRVGSAVDDLTHHLIAEYDIRCSGPDAVMAQLSGGNQQKAVVARELHRGPRLLVVAQPTRGLDVGAMEFVYRRVLEHRTAGGATVLVSSDLEEIMSLSDRVAVLSRGRVLDVLAGDEIDIHKLGLLMAGGGPDAPQRAAT